MWKALIKLVERLSYRCEHDWFFVKENKVYMGDNTNELPIRIERTGHVRILLANKATVKAT